MTDRWQSLIDELPPEARREVEDFVEFLYAKYTRQATGKPFRFDWEGALAHLRERYTSVQLQHETLEHWRQSGCHTASA